eukprot:1157327-Pelagomonas_calceolata.AAC.6
MWMLQLLTLSTSETGHSMRMLQGGTTPGVCQGPDQSNKGYRHSSASAKLPPAGRHSFEDLIACMIDGRNQRTSANISVHARQSTFNRPSHQRQAS